MKLKKYNIIGEDHERTEIVNLLEELLPKADTLFLEALKRGNHDFDGDSLVDLDFVYGWNPGKYDNILRLAQLNGVAVHGLDSWMYDEEFERPRFDVSEWAYYIKHNGYGINLILVGGLHVGYSPKFPYIGRVEDVLPNYFSLNDYLTIQSLESDYLSEGLQKVSVKGIDYFYVYKEDRGDVLKMNGRCVK